jgi:HK97 family phage major capsid protein
MSDTPDTSVEQVKAALADYKAQIETRMTALLAEQKTANDAEVAKLREALAKVEQSIDGVNKAGKSFGLPGFEAKDAAKWSWQKFFYAMYLAAAGGKGNCPVIENPFDKVAPFEKEVCQAYMKKRQADFNLEMERLNAMRFGDEIAKRTANVTDGSQCGFLVPDAVFQGQIVDVVYAQTPILKFPCMKLEGLQGDLPIPKDLSNLTAYMVGETGKPTITNPSFGQVWLRPKKMGVFCKISNRLISFTNNLAEQIVRGKMTSDASVKVSQQLTAGTGTDKQVLGLEAATDGMTAGTAIGTTGGRFTIDHASSMQQSLAVVDELRETNTYGYLMRPEVLWGMKRERILQYSGQSAKNGMPIAMPTMLLTNAQLQDALGAQIGHTTQLSKALTKSTGSTLSRVFYGDWSKFCWATFREPSFRVSDVAGDGSAGSAFLEDELYMVMFWEFDAQILRRAAFCYLADAQTTEANW